MSFLGEIKRRKVFQVAAVYLVVAWLLIQIVATVETPLNLPEWVDTLVILLLAIGFSHYARHELGFQPNAGWRRQRPGK